MSSALINRIKQKNARVRCKMLDYDQNAPLDIKEIASEKKQGIRINDISYAGFADDRVSAYLVEPPGVNPHAGILAGAERRLKAYVLLAALPSMTELWDSSDLSFAVAMRDSLSLEQLARYIEVTAPFDVIHHIGKAAPAPLFFQFATEDEIVSKQDALRLFAAGSEPKMMKWYESGHPLLACNMDGRNDRARWLSEQIGLM